MFMFSSSDPARRGVSDSSRTGVRLLWWSLGYLNLSVAFSSVTANRPIPVTEHRLQERHHGSSPRSREGSRTGYGPDREELRQRLGDAPRRRGPPAHFSDPDRIHRAGRG